MFSSGSIVYVHNFLVTAYFTSFHVTNDDNVLEGSFLNKRNLKQTTKLCILPLFIYNFFQKLPDVTIYRIHEIREFKILWKESNQNESRFGSFFKDIYLCMIIHS